MKNIRNLVCVLAVFVALSFSQTALAASAWQNVKSGAKSSSSESSESTPLRPSSSVPSTLSEAGLESLFEKHEGKMVLVNFFATWCPPCKEEIPGLISIAKERGQEIAIIGLSVDQNPKLLPDFLKEYGINYEVYVADSGLRQIFKVKTIPHNAIFDSEGEVVMNSSGYISEKRINDLIDKHGRNN